MGSVAQFDRDGRLCRWLSPKRYAEEVLGDSKKAKNLYYWIKQGWFHPDDVRRPKRPDGTFARCIQIREDARFRTSETADSLG